MRPMSTRTLQLNYIRPPGHDKSLWNLNPLLEKLLVLDLLQRTEHSRYVPSKQTRARSAAGDIVKCCGWARSGGVLLNHQTILEFLSI